LVGAKLVKIFFSMQKKISVWKDVWEEKFENHQQQTAEDTASKKPLNKSELFLNNIVQNKFNNLRFKYK